MSSEIEHQNKTKLNDITITDRFDRSIYLRSVDQFVNEESLKALERLSNLPEPIIDLKLMPERSVAAVLILLHIDHQNGNLMVTLTTRSKNLRSHPGDTALPGGRVDSTDPTIRFTALREANEEIGLSIEDMNQFTYLCTLSPFVSKNLLVVYPVVYLFNQPSSNLIKNLNPNLDEVEQIFHLELNHLIEFDQIDLEKNHHQHLNKQNHNNKKEKDQEEHDQINKKENFSYSFKDMIWLNSSIYRYHQFDRDDFPSPLSGLTADIILNLISIAYQIDSNDFKFGNLKAFGQEDWKVLVNWTLSTHFNLS